MSESSVLLGDIAFAHYGKALKQENRCESGPHAVFGSSGQVGHHDQMLFNYPSIVVGRKGSVGAITFVEAGGWVIDTAYYLEIKDSSRCDLRYLFHSLKATDLAKDTITTSIPGLNRDTLLANRVRLPALKEQKRIAAILDKADSLRRKRQQAIRLADDFLRAVFLDMFGDPVTNPKGWPVNDLSALGRVSTGRTPPGDKLGMFDGETPFVTPGDLESDAPTKRSLTEAGVAEVSTVRPGAALVCCIGTIGKMGKARKRSAFNQQINAVEWSNSVNDDYGLFALRFFKSEMARQGASTTLPILKKSSFEKMQIPVPPVELQKRFAANVEAAERLGSKSNTSLAKFRALQAALQNEFLA